MMKNFIVSVLLAMSLVSLAQAEPYLYSLKGIYTHPISSKSSLAQQYFDQGMIFYYGYNFEESARSFQEAAKLDPNCAICYWGIALASRGIIQNLLDQQVLAANALKAQQLMTSASPQEQAYIQAMANSYVRNSISFRELDGAFAKEMKEVTKQYPKDADAAALYANAYMNSSDDLMSVKQAIKDALALDPKHPGSNHYYIHLLDMTLQPEEGVTSANHLEHLIPFAGHLLHMPAHIYYKLGKYQEATLATKRAMQADEDLFAKGGLKSNYFAGFYLHNYLFQIASLIMEGKEKEALQVSQKLNDIIESGKPTLSLYSKNAVAVQRLLILQRFGDWDQILKEPNPGTPVGNGMWHFSRTLAYLDHNDLSQAKSEASKIQDQQVDKSENSLNDLLKIMFLEAQSAIAEKEGNQDQMRSNYQEAMKLEEQIAYYEPPLWIYSAREALGFALLRAGNRTEATQLFQEDLKKHPNKIWSRKGLKQSQ
jgi:tetratricopeptide (TPR) repeat protein